MTPLHLTDNAFGGAALYCDRIATNIHWLNLWSRGLRVSEDGWPSVVAGRPGLESRLQKNQYSINRSWSLLAPALESSVTKYDDGLISHMNAKGLTAAGSVLLINLWRRGILVDIDHMSFKTKSSALALAERFGVPVVSSHCCIADITLDRSEIGMPDDRWERWDGKDPSSQPSWPTLRHEGMRTSDDFERIARLGGIAAPLLKQPAVRRPNSLRRAAGKGRELMGPQRRRRIFTSLGFSDRRAPSQSAVTSTGCRNCRSRRAVPAPVSIFTNGTGWRAPTRATAPGTLTSTA